MPDRYSLLGKLFPVLKRVPIIAKAPLDEFEGLNPQETRRRMFEAFRQLFFRLSLRCPILLIIDVYHYFT